ncbi:MAG TPA: chemotaxis protein CheW [Bacillus bacterium]|uniref:Chemotaxis protein CheW n=1 Tax=Siminovitchia fordii TaxID=254759 RepID=A0ABQ4K077_9BACI|nr:chemotaxis protein CheW [Siminovitchia fordii]GIN19177.1 chemotaxis protein CheW [Siminovitchia fordii]HBZ10217.1 chemotaxis protein CheW [Bacillus sp. (in: firmicutes)]
MGSQDAQYVVFAINQNLYAISIHDVSEIIRMQTVKWVPNSREEFLGVIHLREHIIPIISLHRIFSEEEKTIDSKTRMIVLQTKGQEFGFVVDEVDHVMFLSDEHISPAPHMSQSEWIDGVYHHDDKTIALLNLQTLLQQVDVQKALN